MAVTETDERQVDQGPPPAPGPHFLNNVLATAASYVDEDPGIARDLLADLGAFLAYRLRNDLAPVPLADELDFVRTYLRLEQGRFGDRLEATVDDPGAAPAADVRPLSLQAPVQEVLTRRLRDRPGALRVAVRVAGDRSTVRLDFSDLPAGGDPERLVVELEAPS